LIAGREHFGLAVWAPLGLWRVVHEAEGRALVELIEHDRPTSGGLRARAGGERCRERSDPGAGAHELPHQSSLLRAAPPERERGLPSRYRRAPVPAATAPSTAILAGR